MKQRRQVLKISWNLNQAGSFMSRIYWLISFSSLDNLCKFNQCRWRTFNNRQRLDQPKDVYWNTLSAHIWWLCYLVWWTSYFQYSKVLNFYFGGRDMWIWTLWRLVRMICSSFHICDVRVYISLVSTRFWKETYIFA